MTISLNISDQRFIFDPKFSIEISLPLNFHGKQPNHFDAAAATAKPLESADFIGDTRRGGSCNVEEIRLIPHCNGTHTECIGHITDERIAITDVKFDLLIPATLITVAPVPADETGDDYCPEKAAKDLLITAESLEKALAKTDRAFLDGVILRTLPNDPSKKNRRYAEQSPPFFSTRAMQFLSDLPVQHLLVDIPSLDRMYDEGRLSNHHIFWNVPPESHSPTPQSRHDRTVTEMIYAPYEIPDGKYLVSIQIPHFVSDAAPSRVFLFSPIPA